MTSSQHLYEVRPRKDHRGVNLISHALLFGRLWYAEPNVRGAATPKNDRPKRLPMPVGWICVRPLARLIIPFSGTGRVRYPPDGRGRACNLVMPVPATTRDVLQRTQVPNLNV